jgi:hypothetical protein
MIVGLHRGEKALHGACGIACEFFGDGSIVVFLGSEDGEQLGRAVHFGADDASLACNDGLSHGRGVRGEHHGRCVGSGRCSVLGVFLGGLVLKQGTGAISGEQQKPAACVDRNMHREPGGGERLDPLMNALAGSGHCRPRCVAGNRFAFRSLVIGGLLKCDQHRSGVRVLVLACSDWCVWEVPLIKHPPRLRRRAPIDSRTADGHTQRYPINRALPSGLRILFGVSRKG